ncbi:MAG: hypothetical protein Q8L38_03660 [Pseudohongiella sp.]|nr:hypothetical protein [Pseudohongiella sp.]
MKGGILISLCIREFDLAVLIGAGSTVQEFKLGVEGRQIVGDARIRRYRAAHVIDLAPRVREFLIWEKKDSFNWAVLWRYVYQFSRRRCPYRMKLGFNEDAWKLPERPAEYWASAML